ncbi:hypothetical protein FBU30_005559 [Linnemannia zychae]|nr:hypothetical protein FBU30_005559 [Linnemannia zychae]
MRSFGALATFVGMAMVSSVFLSTATADGTAFDSPGAIILGGLGAMVPKPTASSSTTSYLTPGMVNLTSVGVFVNTSTLITFQASGTLKNPLSELPLPLGRAGFSVSIDGQNLANVVTYNLTLPGGTGPLNLNATIALPSETPNPAIQTSLNNLATYLIGRTTPSGSPPTVVISNFTISGTDMGITPITIPIQSALFASPPLSEAAPSPPVIGLWGLLNSSITLESPTLNKLFVKAVSGAKITLGANFEWNNPLNVHLGIPLIAADFSLNGTRIGTVSIQGLNLAPGHIAVADTSIELTFNNDLEASVQLATFINDFLSGQLHQIVSIGNLTFGAVDSISGTSTILNTLFNGVTVDIPLLGYSTFVYQQLIMSFIEPYLPFPINLGGSNSTLSQYIQSLALSTAPGHTLLIQPKIQLPCPFLLDLDIPYLALDLGLNNDLVGQLFFTDIIGSGKGQVSVSVGIGLVFREPSPSIPATVAQIINDLSTGASNGIVASINNTAIGVSPSDSINTLSGLSVAGPISSIFTGSLGGNNSSLQTSVTVAPNIVNIKVGALVELAIHGASINVLPNNLVTAAVKLEMFLGVPVAANIGYLGIQAQLDGVHLADVSLNAGLDYAGGRVQMDTSVALNIATGTTISDKIATLVHALIAKQAVTSVIDISGIVVGDSSSDLINALSGLSFQIPLGEMPTNVISSGGIFNGTFSQLGLDIAGLSLTTIPNAGLRFGTRVSLSNPVPISISIPYIGFSGGLDNVDLLTVNVDNLALVPGANSHDTQVDFNFNNAIAAQAKIAAFLAELTNGQLGSTPELLTAHNLRIGATPSDCLDLFSQVNLAVPSKDVITASILAKLGFDSSNVASDLLNNMKVGFISLGLDRAPIIDFRTSIALGNFSLGASIDIGYLGIDLALDSHAFAHVDIPSIIISTANNHVDLVFQATIAVQDTTDTQTDMANIVNFLMSNATTSSVNDLVMSNPVFGVSVDDNIQTLSLIRYPIALSGLLTEAKAAIAKIISGAGGVKANDILSLSGLALDLNNPSIIGAKGSLQIKNFALPANINISYIGALLGLDSTPLAELSIPSLALISSNIQLSVDFSATFNLQQGQDINSRITKLFSAVFNPGKAVPPTSLVVLNPVFGGDPQHLFHILSQVKFNINIAPYLQQLGTIFNGASTNGSGNLFVGVEIGALKIDLNKPQIIGIETTATIKNIPAISEIKLNYVGVNLAVNNVGLAQVSFPQLTLKSDNGVLYISAHLDIAILTSKALSSGINDLIIAIDSNKAIPITNLVVSGLVFGGSRDNVFTILQGLSLPVNITPYVAKLSGSLKGPSSILNGLKLSGLSIDLNKAPTLSIDADIDVPNLALPAELNIGYIGLSVSASNVPLAKISISRIQLGTSSYSLNIGTHFDVDLLESDASQTLAAGLVDALVSGHVLQGSLIISELTFGPNKNDVYTFLQGVQVPIPIASVISSSTKAGGSSTSASIIDKIVLQSIDINMKNPPNIGMDTAIAFLGFQFDAKLLLNYVTVNAFLDTTTLARISISGITIASGNNQVAFKANTLINLSSGVDIQAKVAAIAAETMGSGGGAPKTNLILSNIAFGASANNVFHILDKVKISIPLGPYIQKLAGTIADISGGNSALNINQLGFTASSASELSVAVDAVIGGVGSKISVEMPYIGLQVSANGDGFVYPSINNLQLSNGKIELTMALPFQPAAQNIFSSLSNPISQLIFSERVGTVPGTLVINNVKFGASADQSFDIASRIGLSIEMSSIFQKLQSFTTSQGSLQLSDINAVLLDAGIDTSFSISGPSLDNLPLKLNFPISFGGYFKNDTFVSAQIASMHLNKSPWSLDMTIKPSGPSTQPAVSSMITNGLQNKDVFQDIILRGLSLGSFTVLSGLSIYLPAIASGSTATAQDVTTHLTPLGADFKVSYTNTGPLRVNMGSIRILVKEGSSTDVMEIYNTAGAIHLNNVHQQGGKSLIPMYAEMKFNFLEFFVILAALMNPGDKFQFQFWCTEGESGRGKRIGWLEDGLNGVSNELYGSFLPGMAKNLAF